MSRILSWIPFVVVVGLWMMAAWGWNHVPDRMPVHWDMAGEVDRVGSKAEGILVLPSVATGVLLLFNVIPRIDPKKENFAQMKGAWGAMQGAILLLLGVLYGGMLGWYPVGRVAPQGLGLLFMVIGAVMGKVRPNYMFGIRTPWTLASKRSWSRTHRAGGFGFLGVGLLILLGGLMSPSLGFGTMLVTLPLLLGGLMYYSYRVWKEDPERGPSGSSVLPPTESP